jgi:hypothetical protein
MDALIEISLPYIFNAGICEAGKIRVKSGKTDYTDTSSNVYHGNYLQSFSKITQEVNLKGRSSLHDFHIS